MPRLQHVTDTRPLEGRKILIIVENLPVPFDRRVWQESLTLTAAGAEVSVICPVGKGHQERYEELDGIKIYRHGLWLEAASALGYLFEYSASLFHETRLAWKVLFRSGFDTIHGCNPPDLIFLVALPFRLLGKKYIFDHHDISPELYEAKFNRRDFLWRMMRFLERCNFRTADVVISTNESYREIAQTRGGKAPEDVFVVRSGPNLNRLKVVPPSDKWKNGRDAMIGYVGVMGEQEGIDLFLEAAHHLIHVEKRNLQFVLMGDGPARTNLIEQSRQLGLAEHVDFLGRVEDAVLFEVLSSADVCVNPDRVNAMNDKSTMNKILEYMAFSKPIVQFDVTEGRWSAADASLYAKPNDTVDFAEKIIEILDNPDKARAMGRSGRHRIETVLNWDYQVDTLVAAYQRAIDR